MYKGNVYNPLNIKLYHSFFKFSFKNILYYIEALIQYYCFIIVTIAKHICQNVGKDY